MGKSEEEDDSLAKLPRWKREKVLKEREMKAAKEAEDELQSRLDEEMEWAENLKKQEVVSVTPVLKDNKAAEKEKEKRRREEKERLEEERIAAAKAEALERDKNPTAADLERRRQEDLEIQAAMAEEIQWALEQKRMAAEEQKSKEDIEREAANARKRAEEEDRT